METSHCIGMSHGRAAVCPFAQGSAQARGCAMPTQPLPCEESAGGGPNWASESRLLHMRSCWEGLLRALGAAAADNACTTREVEP